MIRPPSAFTRLLPRLRRDTGGLAMLEFAFMFPVFLTLSLGGAELTNYVIVRMRISQIALQLADNAARIGAGSQLQAKTISETDINDLLTGAGLQAGQLDLYNRGRVIISSVEPTANPNTANTYKITWQRCRGKKVFASAYANNKTNIAVGVGPDGRKIGAPDGGAAMYIELSYDYKPLIKTSLSPSTAINEIASMMVRDRRDLDGGIYNTEKAAQSLCT